MTVPYDSVRIPVCNFMRAAATEPGQSFGNGEVGIFTTEEEFLERYGAENLARGRVARKSAEAKAGRARGARQLPLGLLGRADLNPPPGR